ncbi:Protein N-acetyltransferase, RimJ/RimL family [Curtobacterium sp. 9128]|uniref:GNAT family N-acetyltransferase n=1 Tax=Curtobacterium sp. 9128 TaxID=1793722 RepID=UPI0007D73398|nr:GNAT family protein [Curtobacterium sp. 9128]SBN61706.1 Protein N-acetyltransferase, RimJ/RimL family [Curtobacterium sp. 9128]
MQRFTVRPIHADEWEHVRELRLRAVHDPVAAMAFVDSAEHTASLPDTFWQDRAAGGSDDAGDAATARQFIAEDESGTWIGSATGLLERVGDPDYEGRPIPRDGCSVVGVFVAPEARGGKVLAALFDAIASWADGPLRLSVHTGNARARRGYEKAGFREVGTEFTGALGPTVEMRRS